MSKKLLKYQPFLRTDDRQMSSDSDTKMLSRASKRSALLVISLRWRTNI